MVLQPGYLYLRIDRLPVLFQSNDKPFIWPIHCATNLENLLRNASTYHKTSFLQGRVNHLGVKKGLRHVWRLMNIHMFKRVISNLFRYFIIEISLKQEFSISKKINCTCSFMCFRHVVVNFFCRSSLNNI